MTATGNEANTRHHFQGALRREMDYEDVEISVEQDMAGFFIELWAGAPELYAISVISPTGERIPKVSLRSGCLQVIPVRALRERPCRWITVSRQRRRQTS